MNIRTATEKDLKIICEITSSTISKIYPKYYPKGAVDLFLAYHSSENILHDIINQRVYILENERKAVGTVTIKNNGINRLFVLPMYQGNGFGGYLLDFSETEISKKYGSIRLDASLPAKIIYLKRGYKEAEYNILRAENGDCLCYDVMEKEVK